MPTTTTKPSTPKVATVTDSYIKLVKSVFGERPMKDEVFADVHNDDFMEVAVAFATFVAPEFDNRADSFRITPTDAEHQLNKAEHEAKQTCCGCAETSVKTAGGRYYFMGYNYGH